MKKPLRACVLPFLLCLSTPFAGASFAQTSIYKAPVSGPVMGTQRVALTYRASFDISTPVSGEVTVIVPFPADDEAQTVEKYSFGSAMTLEKLLSISLQRDAIYGNRFLEIKVFSPAPGDELVFEYVISRREKSNPMDVPLKTNALILPPEKHFAALEVNPTRAEKNAELASQIVTAPMSRDEAIKAIYQKTIALLEPALTADDPQVGRGDVIWILENKRGNSIDFSTVAAQVARAAGIPAKFEIGIPIPFEKEEGEIDGARAWINLYHPQRGWIPLDAFEGARSKGLADYYLGRVGSDRISFAIGDGFDIKPIARKLVPPGEIISLKTQISFKRLPAANPMVKGEVKLRE